MTARAIPRHARTSGRQRWVPPPPPEGRWHRGRGQGIARPGPSGGPMPADPLAGPVAITQRAVVGDRIRRPTAWCEMAACISRYEAQQRSARPTSAPGRSAPGGGTMPSAASCARTASSATRACGPPVPWYRKSTQRPAGPAGAPVTRGRSGSAPYGQHCRRGTRVCGAARTGRTGHTCSRRWPPAATAGTHRHRAQPRARPAAGPARGQQVPASPAPGSRHFTRRARRG